MNWYKDNLKEWKEIIRVISSEIKKDEITIEKDTIQSMFLYELSKSDIPFVFKGGTSLSKAFDLIERFSEDIDLSLPFDPTESQKRKVYDTIMVISKNLGLELENSEFVKSRYDYNKYIFSYNSLFSSGKLEIIVETSFYTPVYPVENRNIQCYVGKFCYENALILPVEFRGVTFEMNVQSLRRTIIDKVFALCDYYLQNKFERYSRHIYDIAKISPYIVVDQDFKKLTKQIRLDRAKSRNNPSAMPGVNINEILKEIIDKRLFEKDYNFITNKLLYESFSYEKAIEEGIKKILEYNIFE